MLFQLMYDELAHEHVEPLKTYLTNRLLGLTAANHNNVCKCQESHPDSTWEIYGLPSSRHASNAGEWARATVDDWEKSGVLEPPNRGICFPFCISSRAPKKWSNGGENSFQIHMSSPLESNVGALFILKTFTFISKQKTSPLQNAGTIFTLKMEIRYTT